MEKYKFYVYMDGTTYGPYSAKEMLGLPLHDNTLVTEESMEGEWLPAARFDFDDMYLKEIGTVINPDGSVTHEETVATQPHYEREESHSTQNRTVPTKKDLSKWNWGAFMFNWLWAIFNGIYWPLILIPLNFIPYAGGIIGLGICIYLGVKGTEMAWNAKSWPSWESFKETQHKWAVAILWVLGISLAIGIIAVIAES